MRRFRHIFGPVLSRRLGLSLGLDLVEHKTCSLNCIYCECGRTTELTLVRREYVAVSEIISELSEFLNINNLPHLDYITYSGSGEPTLNTGIKDITHFIKSRYPQYKIALLTNGTLFANSLLVEEVKDTDLIIPSLDAVSRETFLKINRPHKDLEIERIVEGLVDLRSNYSGLIYLEIFVVPGINDSEEEISRLVRAAKRIMPDKIQLNSLDRPPAESGVIKADYERLLQIARCFEPVAEIVGRYNIDKGSVGSINIREMILETIRRRPVTREELRFSFSLTSEEIDEIIDPLIQSGEIKIVNGPRGEYLLRT